MNRRTLRFGLKPLFLSLLVVGVGFALLYQPRYFAAVKVDLGQFGPNRVETIPATAPDLLEDHCLRIRSARIIGDALSNYDRLQAFASRGKDHPVKWIYDHLRVSPDSDDLIEIRAVGDHSDRQDLQLLVKAMAEAYCELLQTDEGDHGVGIVAFESGWAPNRP